MSLFTAILALYPTATAEDFRLQDDQDGSGPYAAAWNAAKLGPFPEPGALAAKAAELAAAEPVESSPLPTPAVVLELHPKLKARAEAHESATNARADERANELARRVTVEAAQVEQRLREHRLATLDAARRAAEAMRMEAEETAAIARAQADEADKALADVERLAATLES